MSEAAIAWAWDQRAPLNANSKWVLVLLAYWEEPVKLVEGSNKIAFLASVSRRRLGERASMSLSSVDRAVKRLELLGMLTKGPVTGSDSYGNTTTWHAFRLAVPPEYRREFPEPANPWRPESDLPDFLMVGDE